jgi:hypothetical protein
MWHRFARSEGADEVAAPLYIKGIQLRHQWKGIAMQRTLSGKLDTAAGMTAIPISVALSMKLPSAGKQSGVQSFDHSIPLTEYPKFNTEIFIPRWGRMIMPVIGCERDDILLGRDICRKMLLVADWRRCGFGITPACWLHAPLRLLFRWRKVKNT